MSEHFAVQEIVLSTDPVCFEKNNFLVLRNVKKIID